MQKRPKCDHCGIVGHEVDKCLKKHPHLSTHITHERSLFSSYTEIPPGGFEMGNKAIAKVTGKGNVFIALNVEGRRQMCIPKDVLHVPDLGYQLLSASTMDKLGLETSFKHGRCLIK
eukprot:IDg18407t1